MHAHISVHEPKPPDDPDSALSFSMEGYEGMPPSPLTARFWAPGWNSVQAVNKFQSEVDGPLRSGDPGRRLIEPAGSREIAYFHEVPEAFKPRNDELFVVPLHHVFGSEELSILSPGIAERAPKPYLALHPEDAGRLKVHEGGEAELSILDKVYRLRGIINPSLPLGVAGLPAGLPGLEGIRLPAWGRVQRRT
jgi:NADH-quinone oxidoreductase subunit G